jgi:hypothetical protein
MHQDKFFWKNRALERGKKRWENRVLKIVPNWK